MEPDARSTVIPFATRLLRYGNTRLHHHHSPHWSVGDTERYFADEIDAWRTILPQGLLFALANRFNGWQKRTVFVGAESWSATIAERRIWEVVAFKLVFEPHHIQLLEALYNLAARGDMIQVQRRQSLARTLSTMPFESTTDYLMGYINVPGVWSEVQGTPPETRTRRVTAEHTQILDHWLNTHDLLALRHGPTTLDVALPSVFVRSVDEPERRPLLPWLLEDALAHWEALDRDLWTLELDALCESLNRQRRLLKVWIAAIEAGEWFFALLPFVAHLNRVLTRYEGSLLSERMSHFSVFKRSEQDRLKQALARLIEEVSSDLFAVVSKVKRIHPVEREEHHAWMLTHIASALPEETRCKDLIKTIEGRLG